MNIIEYQQMFVEYDLSVRRVDGEIQIGKYEAKYSQTIGNYTIQYEDLKEEKRMKKIVNSELMIIRINILKSLDRVVVGVQKRVELVLSKI